MDPFHMLNATGGSRLEFDAEFPIDPATLDDSYASRRLRVLTTLTPGGRPAVNGIDWVEVVLDQDEDMATLTLRLIHPLEPGTLAQPSGLDAEMFELSGGDRITDIAILGVEAEGSEISLIVESIGDRSPYVVGFAQNQNWLDPLLNSVEFSFAVDCPTFFDCAGGITPTAPASLPPPALDYLARDYNSLRSMLLDRMATTVPDWTDRSPADLGVALVELLAHAGDLLSYRQDMIGTESYIDTAQRRTSIRRHLRLIGQALREAESATAIVHLGVSFDVTIRSGARFWTGLDAVSTVTIDPEASFGLPQGTVVFEASKAADGSQRSTVCRPELNEIEIYPWSGSVVRLPEGATSCYLVDRSRALRLSEGDHLILEQTVDPVAGSARRPDPLARQLVRIVSVTEETDPLAPGAPLGLLHITWSPADALQFSLELVPRGGLGERPIASAFGNLVWLQQQHTEREPATIESSDGTGRVQPNLPVPATTLRGPPKDEGLPAVTVHLMADDEIFDSVNTGEVWTPMPDLVTDSGPDDPHFVVESDRLGNQRLRFGDGLHGRRLPGNRRTLAVIATGVGARGNVGPDTIRNVQFGVSMTAGTTDENTFDGDPASVLSVRNPLSATGGRDAESVELARSRIQATLARRERAVLASDYVERLVSHPLVDGAVAEWRWTGSWLTLFCAVDTSGDQARRFDVEFEQELLDFVEPYRTMGHDIEIEPPNFVPIDLEICVLVHERSSQSAVRRAVIAQLGSGFGVDGRPAMFNPKNLTFGQPISQSGIIATAMAVPGVRSVEILGAGRSGTNRTFPFIGGLLEVSARQILELRNDPNHPDRGLLSITMIGGR